MNNQIEKQIKKKTAGAVILEQFLAQLLVLLSAQKGLRTKMYRCVECAALFADKQRTDDGVPSAMDILSDGVGAYLKEHSFSLKRFAELGNVRALSEGWDVTFAVHPSKVRDEEERLTANFLFCMGSRQVAAVLNTIFRIMEEEQKKTKTKAAS